MRKAIPAALIVLTIGWSIPAPAAANIAVAAPGSFFAGYATPVLVLSKAAPATLANLDVEPHDIRSTTKGPDGNPYFSSLIIGTGETTPIEGLGTTPAGTYEFFCFLHSTTMRGTAVVTS